ncbi:Trithorax group protein osa [Orchesella cincta]|uniref:Trithorax group protein osa n=1 Tax=Orchesella cincta TaxID=48709 RepID=A0A1D2MSD8_ORCCI|nr:Trithorax group protein osa [Orchesella cincta]
MELQQKMGFSPPPHGQGYGPSGPMGPPSNMSSSSPSQTPPPSSGQHGPPPHLLSQQAPSEPGDNSNSGVGGNPPNIVSVGPDGTNVDDVSQQSTLSNASGASGGEDGPAMPKLRKEGHVSHQNYPSHPATPQSNAVPSPGAASMSSAHEEYGEMNSPGWPRTPASPGLNSHPPPPSEQYKTKAKKPDSLQKLYDMDDNPDRRGFLDKLMQYMDEHNTPITACPTISKNPLDLFRLYFLVKERGGFLEVTKNKTWKDIAGSLGIGASSSAAYTLRKHYTKHLLPFECKFDRGGIDPQPLINQVESTSKKKGAKVAPVPSPGSSNSQDSFQGANNNSTSSLDGFNNMPSSAGGGPPTPYGVHPPSEYNQQGNSSTPTSNSSNATSTTVNNSTPPLRPPTHAPVAGQPSSQPSPQGASTPPQPHSHSGKPLILILFRQW